MLEKVKLRLAVAAAALTAIVFASGCAAAAAPKKTLQAFANDQEISDLFKRWADEHRRRDESKRLPSAILSMELSAAAPVAKLAESKDESITNVQHAGVDEGGIVKRHGDHLVILRRGRLFTVRIGDNALAPVSVADAYGNGIDPAGAWYDEMLISGDTIAVIGYSYARGGTEIGLFEISPQGRLRYRSTYHLRSNDYYSSRNYASRLIGSKLVFYTPLYLNPWSGDPFASFPAMRRWRAGATAADFKRIAPATRIYRTDEELDPTQGTALHTVTMCELTKPEVDCESTAVLAAPGRVFYVSSGSVYVWTTPWRSQPKPGPASALFRIPLDGSAPTALKVAGSPIDQFSFLEGADEHLNVLVRSGGRGEAMWAAEVSSGDFALLRVALDRFADGRDSAPASAYRSVPRPEGHAIQSRYIGEYLLYGAGAGWRRPERTLHSHVFAVRYAERDARAHAIPLAHGVDRVEALGSNAVVIGTDGRDLHFTSVRLARMPAAQGRYVRPDAAQGETRSHGFFYRAQGDDAGLVGLPIIGGGRAAGRQLRHESAAVLFLRNEALKLTNLGALDSRPSTGAADACRASCVDWYGNSRPIFFGNRVFALMGYEIVEGEVNGTRLAETRRISFAPVSVSLAR